MPSAPGMDPSTRRAINEQREYYEHRAAGFDADHLGSRRNRCHRAKIERIRQYLPRPASNQDPVRVLEIGTGTGIHAAWLMDMSRDPRPSYVGIDVSLGMLNAARRRIAPPTRLVQSAAEELPFGDSSFDAVYCSGTLHHVSDRALAIAEMRRVVRDGGRVVLSEPNPWNPVNAWAWATIPAERGQLDMRPGRLVGWFESAGLTADRVEFFNFTPPTPEALAGAFDRIDRLMARVPVVRRLASMLLVTGTAKADPRSTP